jgi:hypothetical protein
VNSRWRWAIAAVSVLLVAALLHVRMDAGHMRQVLPPRVAALTHASLDYGRLSFSFVHGLDVRLDTVHLHQTAWTIDAPTVLLELRVIPLLLGKIELQGIYLRSPVIHIGPPGKQDTPTTTTHGLPRELMLDQLSVSDATIINDTGQTLISGLDMDLQDIGPSRMMRWELQARTGEQMASGHGQLAFRFGGIDNGFGKLSLQRIPLQALHDIPWLSGPTDRLSGHGYQQLSTVITLNISRGDQWTAFSETTLSGDKDRPDIKLRGKLYRDASHMLGWKDAFIQFGAGAPFAADGGCDMAGNCISAIRGKSIDLAPFAAISAPSTPAWQPIAGNMNVQADLHWRRHDWSLSGQAEIQGLTWRDAAGTFNLPDFRLDNLLASGKKGGIALKSARIGFIKHAGSLLADGRYDGRQHAGELHLRLNALQDTWVPVLRLTSMIDPAGAMPIGGKGVLQGDARMAVADGQPDVRFSLDATGAELHVGGGVKPAGIPATATGDWRPGRDGMQLALTTATLGASTFKGLRWQDARTRRSLAIDDFRFDMQLLRTQGVRFPDLLAGLQGSIAGKLSTAWDIPVPAGQLPGVWPGMPGLSAELDLGNFGTQGWQLQGHVSLDHGSTVLHQLHVTGSHGSGDLNGMLSFAGRTGTIDIHQGNLNWKSDDSVPAWLGSMHLRGRIKGLNLSWLGQAWKGIDARYRLDGARLDMPELKAGLADGNISARNLAIDFAPGSMRLRGIAQIGAVHVQKLPGLAGLLQGDLTGKTFATVKFDGTLPFQHWQDWRANGDIMIYGGHWRPQPLNGVMQAVHHFDLFGLHFRSFKDHVSIQNIQIENAGGRYSGTARLDAGGRLQGTLTRRGNGAGATLGGTWPHIGWTAAAAPAAP